MEEEVWNMKELLEKEFGEVEADRIRTVASMLEKQWGEDEVIAENKLGLYSPVPSFAFFVEEAIELREKCREDFERLAR